jgi:predicted membrane-bound spermidine synthase
MRAFRLFLVSFLVLFLQVALIRWMPAYVRLLAYFSNFILLAAFLGIGVGCLLTRVRTLFAWYAPLQALVIFGVAWFRLEVSVPTSTSIYFSSGTTEQVVVVESTMLLPAVFVVVAVLFATLAQTMGKLLEGLPPLRGYAINLAGSLVGVGAFALMSWFELPPTAWFAVAFAVAALLVDAPVGLIGRLAVIVLLGASLVVVHGLSTNTIWSPYYKITTLQEGKETVVEVNNIFHQSMAPVREKEYFYQWPYTAFGDGFEDVLILGAGSGTDVAASLLHGSKHIDAVEIDPVILRLGKAFHPDRPYADPRVTVVNDDARHFLRTTPKKYDLVVFALIDSLTLQSSFSSVRLESYMFTEESFRAVKDRLKPGGVLVIYNYFRERWLVDRLANTAAVAFGSEPRVHIHKEHSYLGVLMVGPGLARLGAGPPVPDRVEAYNHPDVISPGVALARDAAVAPATDDWPFLYMKDRHLPSHYLWALVLVLVVSVIAVRGVTWGSAVSFSWHFFFLGAGFMLLETKSIIQFALLWGSTWVVASLAIVSVLTMAMAATWVVSRVEITRPWLVGAVLLALLAASYALPIGRLAFQSLTAESIVYALLMFSPILCAGLLFGSSLKRTPDIPAAYGANLLGAMVGGVAEYLSLVTGFQTLLLVVAGCYVAAFLARPRT